jgi:hypothetical protein
MLDGTMTPPRDGGPVEGNEFVAPVIPLRRTEGGVDTAVVEPEPQVDLFDRADDPESGLDPLEVFVAPLEGLGMPEPSSSFPLAASSSPWAAATPLGNRAPARPRPPQRGLLGWGWGWGAALVAAVLVVVFAASAPHRARVVATTHPPAKTAAASTLTASRASQRAAAKAAARQRSARAAALRSARSRARQRAAAEAAARQRSARAAALRAARARAGAQPTVQTPTTTGPPAQSVSTGAGAAVSAPVPSRPAAKNPCATAVPGQLGC